MSSSTASRSQYAPLESYRDILLIGLTKKERSESKDIPLTLLVELYEEKINFERIHAVLVKKLSLCYRYDSYAGGESLSYLHTDSGVADKEFKSLDGLPRKLMPLASKGLLRSSSGSLRKSNPNLLIFPAPTIGLTYLRIDQSEAISAYLFILAFVISSGLQRIKEKPSTQMFEVFTSWRTLSQKDAQLLSQEEFYATLETSALGFVKRLILWHEKYKASATSVLELLPKDQPHTARATYQAR